MVDSVKNYGLAGVSANVELGKQGPIIDASDSSIISLKDKDGALEEIAIANGTASSHAVTKSQLDATGSQKLKYVEATVNYNSGNTSVGTFASNSTIQSVIVEKGVGNWTDYNSATEITVGDSGDVDRLFAGFDPAGGQITFDNDHTYSADTEVFVYVTQGGASAGSAKVRLWYSGTLN